jgi:hypothetical protein
LVIRQSETIQQVQVELAPALQTLEMQEEQVSRSGDYHSQAVAVVGLMVSVQPHSAVEALAQVCLPIIMEIQA